MIGNSYYERSEGGAQEHTVTDGLGNQANVKSSGYIGAIEPTMVAEMRQQRYRLINQQQLLSQRIETLTQLLSLFEEV